MKAAPVNVSFSENGQLALNVDGTTVYLNVATAVLVTMCIEHALSQVEAVVASAVQQEKASQAKPEAAEKEADSAEEAEYFAP